MRQHCKKSLLLVSGIFMVLIGGTLTLLACTLSVNPVLAQAPASTPVPGKDAWTQPVFLLFRATNPVAAVSPDGFTSYCATSKAWGIVVGAENRGWTAGNFIKVSGQGSEVDCAFDSSGTLHLVWSEGPGVQYAKLYRDGTVSRVRLLPAEVGATGRTVRPSIATSSVSNRVFVTFISLPDSPGGEMTRYFTESSDDGTSWSPVFVFDRDAGYRPVDPVVAAEQTSGEPVIMYGKMDRSDASQLFAIRRNGAGQWSSPYRVAATSFSQFYAHLSTPPQGGVYATWIQEVEGYNGVTDKQVLFSKQLPDGSWQNPVVVGRGGHFLGRADLTVGTNGYIWLMWVDPDNGVEARFAVSTDGGNSFGPPRTAFIGKDLYSSRFGAFSMVTVPDTKRVRVVMELSQDNPLYVQDATLVMAEIEEKTTDPPHPTPAPPMGSIPTPTPTSITGTTSLTSVPGSPSVPGTTATITTTIPSATPVVTTPGTVATGQDSYEPDNNLELALVKGNLLVAGTNPRLHSLYDPSNPDRNRDVDVLLFEGQEGKYYRVEATGNGNQNFQLKGSFYYIGVKTGALNMLETRSVAAVTRQISAIRPVSDHAELENTSGTRLAVQNLTAQWLGAASECNGDKRRLCFSFKAPGSGFFFAQFSNYLEGNGSPQDIYSVRLLEQDQPFPTPTTGNTLTPVLLTPVPTALPDIPPTPVSTTIPVSTSIPPETSIAAITSFPASTTVQTSQTPTQMPVVTTMRTAEPVTTYPPQRPVRTNPVEEKPEPTGTPAPIKTTEIAIAETKTAAPTPAPILLPDFGTTVRGGVGPVLAGPDFTPIPSPTPTRVLATATAITKSTVTPVTTRTPVAQARSSGQANQNPQPARYGEWWLVLIGGLFLVKGGLNFLSNRRLAKAVRRA